MGKQAFRETNWFKLGDLELDEGEDASVPLPIEDRYSGPVSVEDSKAFSLRTGKTEHIKVLAAEPADETALKSVIREMKVNKQRIGIAVAASLAAIASMVALYV